MKTRRRQLPAARPQTYPHLKWEIYAYDHQIGRPPFEKVVALAEDVREAQAVTEALQPLYVGHVNYRERSP